MGYDGNGTSGGATPIGGTTLGGGGVGIPTQTTLYPKTPFNGMPRQRRPIGGGYNTPVAAPGQPAPAIPPPTPLPGVPSDGNPAGPSGSGASGDVGGSVAWPTPQPKPGGTPVGTGPYVPPQRQPLPKQPVPTNPYDKIKRPRPIYTQPGAPAGPKPESM